jgi:hypothetical protein
VPPRTGDAFRIVVRAQRSRWVKVYAYALVTGVPSAFAVVVNPRWLLSGLGIAVMVSWLICAAIGGSQRASARRLAREGWLGTGRVDPHPRARGLYVLSFSHPEHGACGAVWIPNRWFLRKLNAGTPATVLMHEQRGTAFAWVNGYGGSAMPDRTLAITAPANVSDPATTADRAMSLSPPAAPVSASSLELAGELAPALAVPPPRSGDAFRKVLRAQRTNWSWIRAYVIAAVVFSGFYAWFDTDGFAHSWSFWIVTASAPVMFAFALLGYVIARGLARQGVLAPARLEPLGRGFYALYFGDDLLWGKRRAEWNAEHELAPGTGASVLFHPRRRWAFVWAAGISGVARQDARAVQPRAKIHH